MSVTATKPSAELPVNGVWEIVAHVRDLDGELTDAVTPVVTITLPAGSTASPAMERLGTGCYRASYGVTSTGRYVARVVATGYGAADYAAYVSATTAETGMPGLAEVLDYLRDNGGSWTDEEVQDALNAEAASQRRVCRVGAVYPDDLRQALMRRVQRNLAMRGQPYAVLAENESGAAYIPTKDPEVRRLELPYRKVAIG